VNIRNKQQSLFGFLTEKKKQDGNGKMLLTTSKKCKSANINTFKQIAKNSCWIWIGFIHLIRN